MTGPVPLPERLDTRAAADLAQALKDRMGVDVVLDASSTVMIGALGLQTLLVAAATWQHAGRSFTISNLSEEAARQVELMGVDPLDLTGKAA